MRIFLSLMLVVGCGSSSTNQNKSIGAGGGSVTVSDGSGVSVPTGALSASTTISVSGAPSAPDPTDESAVGSAYTFGPEGQQFTTPVTVTLAFDANKLATGTTASDIVI